MKTVLLVLFMFSTGLQETKRFASPHERSERGSTHTLRVVRGYLDGLGLS